MMDKQFDQIADEYDDDNIGELDEDDPSVKGVMDLSQLDYVLDEFIAENSRKKLKVGPERLIPETIAADIPRDYEAISVEENSEEIEQTLDGYDYLSSMNDPPKEKWDCQSILSMYF